MDIPSAMPPSRPDDDEDKLDTLYVQAAIRQLGLSGERTSELQGYIKRLLDEEKADSRESPIELLIMARFQHDWGAWEKEPADTTLSALKECVAALRLGISLLRDPTSSLATPELGSHQPSPNTVHRVASLRRYTFSGPLRAPPLRQPRYGQHSIRGIGRPKQQSVTRNAMPATHPVVESVQVQTCQLDDADPNSGRMSASTPTTHHKQIQTDDVHNSEESFKERYTKHMSGLHHHILVVHEVPSGRPTLVVLDKAHDGINPIIELTEDEDDGPFLDNMLLPARAYELHDSDSENNAYPAPLNITRHEPQAGGESDDNGIRTTITIHDNMPKSTPRLSWKIPPPLLTAVPSPQSPPHLSPPPPPSE